MNDRFQRPGWKPLDLQIQDNFPQSVAAYKQFDVLLVNAIFDGMNLVAKEAPLVNVRDGVMILSENAGAHEELADWAISINPFDVAGQAEAIHTAITMAAERAGGEDQGDSRLGGRPRHQQVDRDATHRPRRSRGNGASTLIPVSRPDGAKLSHVDEEGAVSMVDVGGKPLERRRATARAFSGCMLTRRRRSARFRRATLWRPRRSPASWLRSGPQS